LYLRAAPYRRLYVEVDAVEGCVPDEAAITKLRDFLAKYCDKPDGIEIVRSDVIPRDVARSVSPRALACKYLNGPPDHPAGSQPAYLYVLFYNGALSGVPVIAETAPQSAKAPTQRVWTTNPHAEFLPYPAIMYIDPGYKPGGFRTVAMLHEAGHVLGLALRPTDAAGGHCLSRSCLMNETIRLHYGRDALGLNPIERGQRRLCAECMAQLAESSRQPSPTNLRFVGPVLVRSEAGYHVLSLPFHLELIVGNVTDQDCRDFVASVHAEPIIAGVGYDDFGITSVIKEEVLHDPTRMAAIFSRVESDPYEAVPIALAQVCAENSLFTPAVDSCRHAILLDPKDPWPYNQLAWMKATCADASIRDGNEAVADARKACELSEWKEGDWIDTLAAAYAESGDFKSAIEFEEQALRTGNPSESDQKEMQERLSLYKQGYPFRDNP
jgi:hypothetical protein